MGICLGKAIRVTIVAITLAFGITACNSDSNAKPQNPTETPTITTTAPSNPKRAMSDPTKLSRPSANSTRKPINVTLTPQPSEVTAGGVSKNDGYQCAKETLANRQIGSTSRYHGATINISQLKTGTTIDILGPSNSKRPLFSAIIAVSEKGRLVALTPEKHRRPGYVFFQLYEHEWGRVTAIALCAERGGM